MKKVSSSSAKNLFYVMLFIIFSIFSYILYGKYTDNSSNLNFDIQFYIIGAFIFFALFKAFQKLSKKASTEIFEYEDHLIAVIDKQKHRIDFSNIMNINYSESNNNSDATILLRDPVNGMRQISFIPEYDSWISLSGITKSTAIDKLMIKIHDHQNKR